MSKRSGIMLCYPFEERRLAKWRPPYIIQPKLDGDRCRAIIGEKDVILYSSELHQFMSVPHIIEYLHKFPKGVELDGELYIHGAPHNIIHSIVSRHEENLHSDYALAEFHVFDIVTSHPQVERTRLLIDLFPNVHNRNFSPVQLVPSRIVTTLEEIMRTQDEYARLGYEGFVLREASAPYVRKRSTSLMKFKPRKDDFYEIVGFNEEVSITGVPKGTLGALICTGNDGTRFNVGSGSLLTKEARETLWKERDSLIGKLAHVKYQHMTSARGVPRFPVVVDIVESDTIFNI